MGLIHSTKKRVLLAVLPMSVGAAATTASAAPCPVESKDRWFTYYMDAKYCEVGAAEGDAPRTTENRYYHVYCPGRMTTDNAVSVGRALASGALNVPSNRIPADYKTPYNLTARIHGDGTPYTAKAIYDLGHYNCERNGTPGVATHFKLRIKATPNAGEIARFAVKKNDSGSFGIGKQWEREYFLPVNIKSGHKSQAHSVAIHALFRDSNVRSGLKNRNAKICILDTTDIQCAPCATSDKLYARTALVEKGRACPPSESRWWFDGDSTSPGTGG